MKSKIAKKLTLAKETLRVLNGNDLALVQGASDTSDTSSDAGPTLDPSCLPPAPPTTSSDSN